MPGSPDIPLPREGGDDGGPGRYGVTPSQFEVVTWVERSDMASEEGFSAPQACKLVGVNFEMS